MTENPRAFMRDENRYDRRDRDDDANRRELANFDSFLDKHPEIAEQLRKNPSLADNREFLQNHPALRQFVQEHPGVRQQLAQDPQVFINRKTASIARTGTISIAASGTMTARTGTMMPLGESWPTLTPSWINIQKPRSNYARTPLWRTTKSFCKTIPLCSSSCRSTAECGSS